MGSFITWFCKRIGKKKLSKSDLEGLTFKVIWLSEGHRLVPDISKPLPLGGPPGQVTIQPQFFFNKDLEYLVSGDKGKKSLIISSLKEAPISRLGDLYGTKIYITRHGAPSDRSKVRSHMRILSVVNHKTLERYGYAYLKEIVLRRADYKEYKISETDFKNMHLDDFEHLYLLHLQGQLNHLSRDDKVHLFNAVNLWIRNIVIKKRVEDLQLGIESYQMKLNLNKQIGIASDFSIQR
ncbi:hypothetical protein Tco_0325077 [Tanacetum coccineum]